VVENFLVCEFVTVNVVGNDSAVLGSLGFLSSLGFEGQVGHPLPPEGRRACFVVVFTVPMRIANASGSYPLPLKLRVPWTSGSFRRAETP
jgi:hypothetical protein